MPAQRRSRRTLERLLDAAEALLADRTFDELTVTDVVRLAGSSVGSFYARFPDKESLLGAVYERHQQRMIALVEDELSPDRWAGLSLATLVEQLVGRLVEFHRSHRGLLRALVLFGYAHPDWRYADTRERTRLPVTQIADLMAARRAEVGHPDARAAALFGTLSVLATLREIILFAESTSSALSLSDHQLTTELSRQLCAYLDVRSPASEPQGSEPC